MGHVNGILARVGRNLNNNSQKRSNVQEVGREREGGMLLKLRFDQYITTENYFILLAFDDIYMENAHYNFFNIIIIIFIIRHLRQLKETFEF